MSLFFAKHPFLRKALVTLGLLSVFMLGRVIPVPHVILGDYVNLNPFLDTLVSLTGGRLSEIGLFSLGLGPMMAAMLLAQLFSLGKGNQQLSPRLVNLRQNLLLLVIALIQGMSLAVNLTYPESRSFLGQVLEVTVVLSTGAIVIKWLGELNGRYGFGGSTVLLLTSILLNQFKVLGQGAELWAKGLGFLVLGFVVWGLLTIFLMVYFDRSEYRIPVKRISIHNSYAAASYIPFKVNIAGGMPLMYAYSILSFPQYVIMLLVYLFPDLDWLTGWGQVLSIGTIWGVLVYLLVIVVLTFLMAFVAVDVVSLTEGLRQSGDYIPHIRPGLATKSYLSRYVSYFAGFNATYLVVLTGIPLVVSLIYPEAQPLVGLVGVLMMTAGIVLNLREEVKVMHLKKGYKTLFD